jgi:hypothetical protein
MGSTQSQTDVTATYLDALEKHILSRMPLYTYNMNECDGKDISKLYTCDNKEEREQLLSSLRLREKKWMFNDKKYTIVRYDKTVMPHELYETAGVFRSVIYNEKGDVCVFSPPKSIPIEKFTERYSSVPKSVIAEEFIEGTMVNVFWDGTQWEMATRSSVGGKVSFFTTANTLRPEYNQTFRYMFIDAIASIQLKHQQPNPEPTGDAFRNIIDELFDNKNTEFFKCLEQVPKNVCFSFVLQHPQNRIVVPLTEPKLYLVAVYEIVNEQQDTYVRRVSRVSVEQYKSLLPVGICYPEKYEFETFDELREKYAGMMTDYSIQGVMLTHRDTGVRSKMRNPNYEKVRFLRGNQPKLQYRYLMLRQKQSVGEYLKYYPEHKHEFSYYRKMIHQFTRNLHQCYLQCYVFKQKPLKDFPFEFKTHMYALHQHYTTQLVNQPQYQDRRITLHHVVDYVNHLHPSKLMHSMNYPMKPKSSSTETETEHNSTTTTEPLNESNEHDDK